MRDTAQELAERAENLESQGKEEQADEVMQLATLAGYSESDMDSMERGTYTVPLSAFADEAGTLLSDIEEQEVDWLWPHWLPLGCVSILVGAAGIGKSTLCGDLIARVTTDRLMPDGSFGIPGGVVVISLEEKTSSMVVPRLRRAGANLTRIIDLSKVKRKVENIGDPAMTSFMLPDDLPILEAAIRKVQASLVIVDPLMSAVNPKVSTFRNQSARQVVQTFQELADRLGVAVLIVNHFTKGGKGDPMERMAGSKGFSDIIRSLLLFSVEPSDAAKLRLSLVKHNLGPAVPDIVMQRGADGRLEYLSGLSVHEAEVQQAARLSRSHQDIKALLESDRNRAFTPSEVTQRLHGLTYDNVKQSLRRMAEAGYIERNARGMYLALPIAAAQPERSAQAVPSVPSVPSEDIHTAMTEVFPVSIMTQFAQGTVQGGGAADASFPHQEKEPLYARHYTS